LSIERISAWISASGLLVCALARLMFNDQMLCQVNSNSLPHRPLGRFLNKVDIKDPPLERRSSVFGYNGHNELRYRPCKQPRCDAC
jgi:hypothetical protein